STANILAAANAVISNNSGRLGKELRTDDDDGEPISLYAAFNEQDEARYIADLVDEWARAGRARTDMAVLYRSNAQSRTLEEAFLRAGIPYRIYGGQRFYERLEIKNALSYCRLLLNREDDAAVERVINVPARAIGEKTVESLRAIARDEGCSLWMALHKALEHSSLPKRAAGSVQGFIDLIEEMSVGAEELPLHELVDNVIQQSGLIEHHRKEKGEKGQARVDNLEELVTAARQFEPDFMDDEEEDESALARFLDSAALEAGEGQADEYDDAVQLMTLHSAKGLEFPQVVLAGVEEGLFPHKMSMDEAEGLEEERRLAYVGITRAMEKLIITYAESRRLHGQENFSTPSRFIREIPTELIQEVRLKNSISRPLSARAHKPTGQGSSYGQPQFVQEQYPFALGQRVFHEMFGEGTVLQFEGQGPGLRIQVNFDDAGSKWLVASFAKLEAI
ncbi:MAG: 3'-5' exonuclease, partial [Thalassolituus sp.]